MLTTFFLFIYIWSQYIISFLLSKILGLDNVNLIFKKKNGGNLYLGDFLSSRNISFLKKNNIDTIINCTNDLPFQNKIPVNKLRCGINDIMLNNKKENDLYLLKIKSFLKTINSDLTNNKNVLIHCRNGMQRSAVMIAAYLIKYENFNKNKAIQHIKNKRWAAFKPINLFDDVLENISR